MPWCEPCGRFYNPNTLDKTGGCPEGHLVARPTVAEPIPPVPWHFKLLVAATAIYLAWRLLQLLGWFLG